jgi:hypothetical protein
MWWVYGLVSYCVLDFLAGMALGRCVLPGLRCAACRRQGRHGRGEG